jgi:hypothetical protein
MLVSRQSQKHTTGIKADIVELVVLLTLGAAVVGKYHHAWHVYNGHYVFGRKKRQSRPVSRAVSKGFDFTRWLQRKTWRTPSRIAKEYRDTVEFIKNPFFLVLDTGRDRTSDYPTVKYSFAGSLPFPGDQERNDFEHYQGPWIKDDDTWRDFNVEFLVEVDDRTLKSWERYQHNTESSTPGSDGEHIVYSILLPPVPNHPDKRTVLADSDIPEIQPKASPTPNRSSHGANMDDTIVPGARRASTIPFGLQTLPFATKPSAVSSETAGSSPGGSISSPKKQGTFVVETAIPQSSMSSVHEPGSPKAPVTIVPPVPILNSTTEPASSATTATTDTISEASAQKNEDRGSSRRSEEVAAGCPLLAESSSDTSA